MADNPADKITGAISGEIEDLVRQSKEQIEKEVATELKKALQKQKRTKEKLAKHLPDEFVQDLMAEEPEENLPAQENDQIEGDQIYATPEEDNIEPATPETPSKADIKEKTEEPKETAAPKKNLEEKPETSTRPSTDTEDRKENEPEQSPAPEKPTEDMPLGPSGQIAPADRPAPTEGAVSAKEESEGAEPEAESEENKKPSFGRELSRRQAEKRRQKKQEEFKRETEGEDTDKSKKYNEMDTGIFAMWLSFALFSDTISLLPYVGLVASWPFAGLFFFYKLFKGLRRRDAIMVSIADVLLEGIFSVVPANTLDVLLTYILPKLRNKPKDNVLGKALEKLNERKAA